MGRRVNDSERYLPSIRTKNGLRFYLVQLREIEGGGGEAEQRR